MRILTIMWAFFNYVMFAVAYFGHQELRTLIFWGVMAIISHLSAMELKND